MSFPYIAYDKPDPVTDNKVDIFTHTRENLQNIIVNFIANGIIPIGWKWSLRNSNDSAVTPNPAKPEMIKFTKDSYIIQLKLTWTGYNVTDTQVIFSNDNGQNYTTTTEKFRTNLDVSGNPVNGGWY